MHIDRSGSSFVAMAMLALLFVACGTEAPTATPTTAAAPTVAPPTATPTPADQPLVSPGASKVTIALPAIGIQTMALHTALEGGFFERHGLDVTLTTMSTPMDVMRAVRMGRADLAVVPPHQVVNSQSSPRPLVTIGAVAGATQLNVVIAVEAAAQRGLTAESPLAERLRGLEGLRLAHPPGPLGINTAMAVVAAAGLEPAQVELVPTAGQDEAGALRDGLIDAFVGHHPYIEEVIVDGTAMMLVHLTGGELPLVGGFPNQVLAVTPDAVSGKAELLRTVLSALQEAQQAIREDPAVAAQALAVAFPDLSGPILEQGVSIYAPGVPETPAITEEAYQIVLAIFGLREVPFQQVVDNSLIAR